MKSYSFRKLDAFTTGASPGNPAGCITLDHPEDISAEDMQRIACELGAFVSEVVYIWATPNRDWAYELKYYSREREVNFCGHGTVAAMHDLLRRKQPAHCGDTIKIKTPVGLLEVEDRIAESDLVFIAAPEPQFHNVKLSAPDAAKALNLREETLALDFPPAFVNAGLNTLLADVKTLADCINCRPDYETLRKFCLENGIEVVTLYTFDTALSDSDVRTRVFCPRFGYLEDPATGSGNAALGYFLASQGRWNKTELSIEQGASQNHPNRIILKKSGDRLQIGGRSICRIEGNYFLA